MDKKIAKVIILTLAVTLALGITAFAQAPNTILYQGRLTDDIGDPITIPTTVTFSIYEDSNDVIYVDTFIRNVTFNGNGVFTTELGPFTSSFLDGDERWLGIKVGADPEMSDRQLITSVPYAYSSEYAQTVPDNSITTSKIASGAVGNSDLANSSVNSAKIANFSIIGSDVANSTLTGTHIQNASIQGVDILNGTLTKYDISDEPGLSRSYKSTSTTIATTGVTIVDSVTITTPAAGYVVCFASGVVNLSGFTIGNIRMLIATEKQTTLSGELVYVGSTDEDIPVSEMRYLSIFAERSIYFASSGSKTLYLNADRGFDGGTGSIGWVKMVAIFLPTSYGTISANTPESGISQFENVEIVNETGDFGTGEQVTQTSYKVDLRELEIKASKAEAEAERAQKELLEARLRQQENENQE